MNIFKDDVGTMLELEFRDYEIVGGVETDKGALDISGATEIEFLFLKPGATAAVSKKKTTGEVQFTTDGVDGKAYYKTAAGFLDTTGAWTRQGKLTMSDGTIHYSATAYFAVLGHI